MYIINEDHMIYGSRDIRCGRQNVLSFWTIFWPNSLENQNFEKAKKTPGDIIILHMCIINDYRMTGFDNYHKIAIRDHVHVPKF